MVKGLGEIVRTMAEDKGRTDVLATYREREAWWRTNVPVLIKLLAGPYPHTIQLLRDLEGMGGFNDALWEPARTLGPRGRLADLLATAEALRQRLEQVRDDPAQRGEPVQWHGPLRRSNEGNWKRRLMSRARAILAEAGVRDRWKQTELLEIIALQVPAAHLDALAADL
jgi:hypothetical protein